MICTVTKYDVESCTKMLQVVVGCSELQWDVNCHCMLLHDIKYCCQLHYATGWYHLMQLGAVGHCMYVCVPVCCC